LISRVCTVLHANKMIFSDSLFPSFPPINTSRPACENHASRMLPPAPQTHRRTALKTPLDLVSTAKRKILYIADVTLPRYIHPETEAENSGLPFEFSSVLSALYPLCSLLFSRLPPFPSRLSIHSAPSCQTPFQKPYYPGKENENRPGHTGSGRDVLRKLLPRQRPRR
jgi:hypothetical protein